MKKMDRKESVKEDQAFHQHMLEEVWNNPKDEKASEFYKKRYL